MDAIMEEMAGEMVEVVIKFSLKGRRRVRTRFDDPLVDIELPSGPS